MNIQTLNSDDEFSWACKSQLKHCFIKTGARTTKVNEIYISTLSTHSDYCRRCKAWNMFIIWNFNCDYPLYQCYTYTMYYQSSQTFQRSISGICCYSGSAYWPLFLSFTWFWYSFVGLDECRCLLRFLVSLYWISR